MQRLGQQFLAGRSPFFHPLEKGMVKGQFRRAVVKGWLRQQLQLQRVAATNSRCGSASSMAVVEAETPCTA